MKKQITLALAAALSLSVAGGALATPANPFVDVPANHWAYDAISALQKDGVVDGYGDGTFRGDRTLTRYEMAAMIAKITYADGKHESLIKRLQSEFANELYNLGVRVDALEKNASTIKFTGEGRIRYQQGMAISDGAARMRDENGNSSSFQQRILLHMEAEVTDNVKFYGRINGENSSNNYKIDTEDHKTSETGSLFYEQAEFNWTNSNFSLSAGRLVPTLGQGLIWDDASADGFLVTYDFGRAQLTGGYLDLDANHGFGASVNAAVVNLNIKLTDKADVSVAYLKAINPHDLTKIDPGFPDGYAFKQLALGKTSKLGKDFTITSEYVNNYGAPEGAQKIGRWSRIKWKEADIDTAKSFSIYFEYLKLGGWSVDSTGYGHTLNISGGNGIGRDGAKGYGLGFEYVPAKNILMELNGYNLKTHDGSQKYKNAYNFATNFYF